MNKQILNILTSSVIILGLYSCATTATIETSSKTDYKIRTADYKQIVINKNEIYQKPLVADLDVAKQKVSMTKTYENLTVEQAKENITGEFVLEQGCDILVQPLYQTETSLSDDKSTTIVSVSGYPAFYKNIRTYMPSDSEAFMIKSIIGSVKSSTVDKPSTSVAVSITNTVAEVKKVVNKKSAFFELGAEASNPMGDFGKYQSLGYGLFGKLGVNISKGVNLHADLAYLSYGGKSVTETDYIYFYTYKYPSLSVFRYMGGLDFKLTKGLYLTLQSGMSNLKQNFDGVNYKESDFTYNVGFGYLFSKLDFNIYFNSISGKQQSNSALGLRLGYRF
jgi:hypothetical protein